PLGRVLRLGRASSLGAPSRPGESEYRVGYDLKEGGGPMASEDTTARQPIEAGRTAGPASQPPTEGRSEATAPLSAAEVAVGVGVLALVGGVAAYEFWRSWTASGTAPPSEQPRPQGPAPTPRPSEPGPRTAVPVGTTTRSPRSDAFTTLRD